MLGYDERGANDRSVIGGMFTAGRSNDRMIGSDLVSLTSISGHLQYGLRYFGVDTRLKLLIGSQNLHANFDRDSGL
jgi:hypothetical protein